MYYITQFIISIYSLNIDSAYLFTRQDAPKDCPSLRECAKHVLGITLPEIHDSARDATVAMNLVHFVRLNGLQPPIPRLQRSPDVLDQSHMLLVHRIPDLLSDIDIFNMIVRQSSVVPISVQPIVRSGITDTSEKSGNGKTSIIFSSTNHCNLAFDAIPGPDRPDKGGKAQKRVYLKGGGYLCVRKYA
jgi:hypothetical protein